MDQKSLVKRWQRRQEQKRQKLVLLFAIIFVNVVSFVPARLPRLKRVWLFGGGLPEPPSQLGAAAGMGLSGAPLHRLRCELGSADLGG
jgi:hypothetical protein